MRHVPGPGSSARPTESDERKAPPRPARLLLRPERSGDAEGRPAADRCAEAVEIRHFARARLAAPCLWAKASVVLSLSGSRPIKARHTSQVRRGSRAVGPVVWRPRAQEP